MSTSNISYKAVYLSKHLYDAFVMLVVFTLSVVVTQWRFNPWLPEVFFGDDLINILAYREGKFPSSFWELLTYGDGGKFRPIAVAALGLLHYLYDVNIERYMLFNALLNGVNACMVFAIAQHLTKRQTLVSGSIALVTAASRFSLYQVSQVTGILESIGCLLFLSTIYCLIQYTRCAGWRANWWALASVICSISAFHTHELFIGLVLWTGIAIIVLPANYRISWLAKLALAGTGIFAIIANIAHKQLTLKTPFLMGTGGQEIGFDLPRILSHAMQAFLSVAGLNEGPEYLVGLRSLSGESWPALIFGGLFFLGWVAVITKYCLCVANTPSSAHERWNFLSWLLLFAVLAALLVIPAIMTIRVEQRWLLESFILLLLALAFVVGSLQGGNLISTLVIFILWCLFVSDTFVSRFFGRVYMVESCRFAAVVKNELLDNESVDAGRIILLAKADHCDWTLLGGRFFSVYSEFPARFECIESLEEITNSEHQSDASIYKIVNHKPVDITETVKLSKLKERSGVIIYNFLDKFNTGIISNTTRVDTPNSRGVLRMSVPLATGEVDAVVVVSGFSYRFTDIKLPSQARFEVGLDMFHSSRYPLTARITIEDAESKSKEVREYRIKPRPVRAHLTPEEVIIDLAKYSSKTVSVTFEALTEAGDDSTAHWAAFISPSVVEGLSH